MPELANSPNNYRGHTRPENARRVSHRLTVGLLKDEPDENKREVRIWAIDILNLYSEVKMDEKVKAELGRQSVLF